jgi:hypothetical protein
MSEKVVAEQEEEDFVACCHIVDVYQKIQNKKSREDGSLGNFFRLPLERAHSEPLQPCSRNHVGARTNWIRYNYAPITMHATCFRL